MKLIKKEEWQPVDGIVLEESALFATKSSINMLVVAGPGAGKSELLAQRACYLLQTNECEEPHKILAVSFKKDAASNIEDRVFKRCGKELGERFVSMTFDAFAKSLVDQFLNAIPYDYRPKKNYEIVTDDELINILKEYEIFNYTKKWQYKNVIDSLTSDKLPFTRQNNFVKNLWQLIANTEEDGTCYLTFRMMGRLAEYLVANNPLLKKAINMTYSHIFLDEYQDTTSIQYDLLKTCFWGTNVIITAVGDDKQRIMVWAGALKDAFQRLVKDFNAVETMLVMNHRSAPRLLQIQKTLYREYFYKNSELSLDIENNAKWDVDDGKSYLHLFNNDDDEASILTNEILELVGNGYEKKDICILVKQTPDIYCMKVINKLSMYGIRARNEAKYQDLLKEDLVKLLLSVVTVLVNDKALEEWIYFTELFKSLNENSEMDIYKSVQLEKELHASIVVLKDKLEKVIKVDDFKEFINDILEVVNKDKIKSKYIQYRNENILNKLVNQYCELLWSEYKLTASWEVAVNNFKGENSIPIMTIHKSKGLEYDCVFFVGLEDNSFWSFSRQKNEDFCAFFVALSRAKKRVDFTFCKTRSLTSSHEQTKECIKEFYEILANSGIVETIEY